MASEAKPEEQPAAPPPPAFAGKARDLEALRTAVVDAANVGTGFWFSYLFVLLYFLIAVGGVTHKTLFFESPVRLPIVGVDLPLTGFFFLGPLLFLIVHAYILLHFVLLADKVGAFHAELLAQIDDEEVRARLRRQLPSNIFVQFLAGPREVRNGLMGAMLRLIALISLVLAPLALLLFFVVQFLPYHDEAITWWHRIAVVIDFALLWALWPTIAAGNATSMRAADLLRPGVIAAAAGSSLALLFVFTIATFPGEWLHRNLYSLQLVPQFDGPRTVWVTPHEVLFAGNVDMIERRRTSLWSNSLVLPNLEQPEKIFSARGRHLNRAIFISANLAKVDFTAASLDDAIFNGADLTGAKFVCEAPNLEIFNADKPRPRSGTTEKRCAFLRRASFQGTRLQNADLTGAELKEAEFRFAHLQGTVLANAKPQKATFNYAQLQGANFYQANLAEAVFDDAKLQGASLKEAQLQKASLKNAVLSGAVLDEALLMGASLRQAQAQGASFHATHLEGAFLQGVQLQGADLHSARLQGADLSVAQLHGASLDNALLDGAILDFTWLQGVVLGTASLRAVSIEDAFVWRSDPRQAQFSAPSMARVRSEPVFSVTSFDCREKPAPCEWSAEWYAKLKSLIERQVPEGAARAAALNRIALLDPAVPQQGEEQIAMAWANLEKAATSYDAYRKALASVWVNTGCEGYIARHAYRDLYNNLLTRVGRGTAEFRAVVAGLLDEKHCESFDDVPANFKNTLQREARQTATPDGRREPGQVPDRDPWP
jgi:uncharacterized protein YjbI with pentapeptide repeats